MESEPIRFTQESNVPATANNKARKAKLAVRFCPVSLRTPYRFDNRDPLKVYAVYATEIDCPEAETPLSWMLLTTEVVADVNMAATILRWYIRLAGGFVYLVAIMDWYSRFVLAWQLSNTMDTEFCLAALEAAFDWGVPEIFNSDQGSQFTGNEFTSRLQRQGIQISQDGRGRVFDNIFVERLWRSVKYEEVYLKDYESWFERHR
jgi:transposase InsO family protein